MDCATSLKHFNNYYFLNNPKSAFVAHYTEEGKNTERRETSQCHYCDIVVSIISTSNIVLVAPDLSTLFKVIKLKVVKIV